MLALAPEGRPVRPRRASAGLKPIAAVVLAAGLAGGLAVAAGASLPRRFRRRTTEPSRTARTRTPSGEHGGGGGGGGASISRTGSTILND